MTTMFAELTWEVLPKSNIISVLLITVYDVKPFSEEGLFYEVLLRLSFVLIDGVLYFMKSMNFDT